MNSDMRNGCSHPLGSPIRKSPDHSLLAASRSLSQLTTSFIAYLRQGIHTHALSSLTIKSTSHTTERYFLLRLHYLCFVNARQIFNCQRTRKLSAFGHQLSAKTSLLPETREAENWSLTADRCFWWAWVESNHRPHPYQGCALAI
jgi:hypothetical protein